MNPQTIALVLALVATATVAAQQPETAKPTPSTTQDPGTEKPSAPSPRDIVFDMGQIGVVGGTEGQPRVGGAVLTSEQIRTFDAALDIALPRTQYPACDDFVLRACALS